MLEREVETYFVSQVEKNGGSVRKLKWINRSNAPDRFVALNGAWLVELKANGKKERPAQTRERKRLELNGVRCRVINSVEGVDAFIKEVLACPCPV